MLFYFVCFFFKENRTGTSQWVLLASQWALCQCSQGMRLLSRGAFWATSYLLLYIWKMGQIIFWDLSQVFKRAKLSHKDTNSGLWNSVTPAGPQNLPFNSPELQNHQLSTRIVLFSLKKKTILLGEFLRKWQIILLFWFVCMYVCVYASVCVEDWLWKHFQRWNIKKHSGQSQYFWNASGASGNSWRATCILINEAETDSQAEPAQMVPQHPLPRLSEGGASPHLTPAHPIPGSPVPSPHTHSCIFTFYKYQHFRSTPWRRYHLIAGVIPLLCSQPEEGQTHSGYGLSSNSSVFGPLSPALPPSRATWKVTQVKLGDRDVHTKHSLPKPTVWHPAWYQWFGRPSKHLSSQIFLPLNNNLILPLTKGKNTSLQSSLASRTTLSPVHMQAAI